MKRDGLVLLSTLAAAAALRLNGIGARSLWFDEALSASLLDFGYLEIVRRCAEPASVHPPLYFVALKAWASVAGESEVALRLFSAAFGLFTVLGIYLLVREMGRLPSRAPLTRAREAALLAALLTAFSPMQIELSRTVRGYTLASAALTLAGWAVLRALHETRRVWPWLLASLLAVVACYTHHISILSVAAGIMFATAFLLRECWVSKTSASPSQIVCLSQARALIPPRSPRWELVALAFFVAVYLIPWTSKLILQSETIRHDGVFPWAFDTGKAIRELFLAMASSYDVGRYTDPVFGQALSVLLAGVLIFLAVRGGRSRAFLVAISVLPAGLLFAFSYTSDRSVFHARYLCFVQLAWLAASAVAVSDVRTRILRYVIAAELIICSVYACYENWDLLGTTAKPGMREAARFILSHRGGGEPIVAQSPFDFFGLRYYTRGVACPLLSVRSPGRLRQFSSEHLLESDLVDRHDVATFSEEGLWVVVSNSYNPSLSTEPLIPPQRLQAVGEWSFAQDRWQETPIRVIHYRTRDSGKGRSSGGPASGSRND